MAGEDAIRRAAVANQRLRRMVAEAVRRLWRTVPDMSDASLDVWLQRVVPLVAGAQLQASAQTAAVLAAVLTEMTGRPARPAVIDPAMVSGAATRNGAPPEDVYRRPFAEARAALAEGLSGEALRRGEVRALDLAATDMQLARTHTSRQVLAGTDGVVGYRRTLTGAENCGICTVASTQRYHKANLLPIHPGCDCGVAPILGTEDPGRVINEPLLESTHAEIADRFGEEAADLSARSPAYRDLITTYEHGEYGPTLAVAGQHHMTAAEAFARGN